MENFDRENIDELLEIHQIRQYFPPSKICAVRYITCALAEHTIWPVTGKNALAIHSELNLLNGKILAK